jgi:hypothetical protein
MYNVATNLEIKTTVFLVAQPRIEVEVLAEFINLCTATKYIRRMSNNHCSKKQLKNGSSLYKLNKFVIS